MKKFFVIKCCGEYFSSEAFNAGFCKIEWTDRLAVADKFATEDDLELAIQIVFKQEKNKSPYLKVETYYKP